MKDSGDYTSREALVARIRYHIEKAKFCGLENHEATQLLTEAADALEQIPATDVRPVVRGEWEEEDSASNRWSFRCSVCGKGGRGYKFNYCSNCGADMRGEQDV